MGLLGKMTGCAAIVSSAMRKLGNGRLFVETSVKTFGVLGKYNGHDGSFSLTDFGAGFWISTLPDMSIDDDFMITMQEQPVPRHVAKVSSSSDRVLEVDLETAWKEMGLRSGWSNEVQMKVYFST